MYVSTNVNNTPVVDEQESIVVGHILSNTKKLFRFKIIKFLIQKFWRPFKLCIRIQNNKFVKWKHEVIERRNVKQVLKYILKKPNI